jgi:hypothetical protein
LENGFPDWGSAMVSHWHALIRHLTGSVVEAAIRSTQPGHLLGRDPGKPAAD